LLNVLVLSYVTEGAMTCFIKLAKLSVYQELSFTGKQLKVCIYVMSNY